MRTISSIAILLCACVTTSSAAGPARDGAVRQAAGATPHALVAPAGSPVRAIVAPVAPEEDDDARATRACSVIWDTGPQVNTPNTATIAITSWQGSFLTADDFVVPPGLGVHLDEVVVDMFVFPTTTVSDWVFDVYTDEDGEPATLVATVGGGIGQVVGGQVGADQVRVTWSGTGVELDPGMYWLSAYGVADSSTYWGCAYKAVTEGDPALQKPDGGVWAPPVSTDPTDCVLSICASSVCVPPLAPESPVPGDLDDGINPDTAQLAWSAAGTTELLLGEGTQDEFIGTDRIRGNVINIGADTVLTEIRMDLNFAGNQTLTWVVYEANVSNTSGPRIFAKSETVMGAGRKFYSSGPICVPLKAGGRYGIGVHFNASIEYFVVFDAGGQSFALGNTQGGFGPNLLTTLPTALDVFELTDDQYSQHLVFGGQRVFVTSGGNGPLTSQDVLRGNFYEIDRDCVLSEIVMRLNATAGQVVTWVVYEGDGEGTTHTLVHQLPHALPATGEFLFQSPPMNVPLRAGKTYAIGIHKGANTVGYFQNVSGPAGGIPFEQGRVVSCWQNPGAAVPASVVPAIFPGGVNYYDGQIVVHDGVHTTDTFPPSPTSSALANIMRGVTVDMDESVALTQIKARLDIPAATNETIRWLAYRIDNAGNILELLHDSATTYAGVGEQVYSSDAVCVPLRAGSRYFIGYFKPGATTEYLFAGLTDPYFAYGEILGGSGPAAAVTSPPTSGVLNTFSDFHYAVEFATDPLPHDADTTGIANGAFNNTNAMRGDTVTMTADAVLTNITMDLDPTGNLPVTWVIYEADAPDAVGALIWSRSATLTDLGRRRYSSGPMSVLLRAGKSYAIGVHFAGSMNYFRTNDGLWSPQPFDTGIVQYCWAANGTPTVPATADLLFSALDVDFAYSAHLCFKCSTTYDVYVGSDASPETLACENLLTPMCDIPFTLPNGLDVYWQVVAENCCASAAGEVWSFETSGSPCPIDFRNSGAGTCGDLGDGIVDSDDYICFLQLFADGDPAADISGPGSCGTPNGVVDSDDYICFLIYFASGCP